MPSDFFVRTSHDPDTRSCDLSGGTQLELFYCCTILLDDLFLYDSMSETLLRETQGSDCASFNSIEQACPASVRLHWRTLDGVVYTQSCTRENIIAALNTV